MERDREQTMDLHMGIPFETVKLTALGNNRQKLIDILEDGEYVILIIFVHSSF